MTTLNVCCKLSKEKINRFQVEVPSLDKDVDSLISEIKAHLANDESDFDILFCGQVLQKSQSLSSYFLQHHSTVYVVQKFVNPEPKNDGATGDYVPSKAEVSLAIQSALLNANYRSIVERLVCDPEKVENIIAAVPNLDKDPSVLAMLQEPELLAVLAHRNNMDSLLKHHPVFAQAAISIATSVNEARKGGTKNDTAFENLTYSMDQMSDEEDDMPQPNIQRVQSQGSSITASQLAAALQAATGAGGPASAPSTSQQEPGPSSSGSITSDFFQQAMAHAQSASSDAALQQLREMGITDENVARQALAVTGGDIQAAIDLIFGDGLM